MAERRKLARFEVSAPVRLLVGDGETQRLHETQTRDLSSGGAFVYIDDPALSVGDDLELEIVVTVDSREHLDDSPRRVLMKGRGRITRKDPEGLGVEFSGQLNFG